MEHGVGYARRNFLTSIPEAESFAQLNACLRAACARDDSRRVDRQPATISQMWTMERRHLRALPRPKGTRFPCCRGHELTLNPYSQVVFETNRYSVARPGGTRQRRKHLTLKA